MIPTHKDARSAGQQQCQLCLTEWPSSATILRSSITSLKMLFDDMEENTTSHSYQRTSESECSRKIAHKWQRGGVYDHPSPISSIYRIRIIILCKSPSTLAYSLQPNRCRPATYNRTGYIL